MNFTRTKGEINIVESGYAEEGLTDGTCFQKGRLFGHSEAFH